MTLKTIRMAAMVAVVLTSCFAVGFLCESSDAVSGTSSDPLCSGDTVTVTLYTPTDIVCAVPRGSNPVIVDADIPDWIQQFVAANLHFYIYCIPTQTGTFSIDVDYHPSPSSEEVLTFAATIIVVDSSGNSSPGSSSDASSIDVEYTYTGDNLILRFSKVDTSSVSDPYFYIAVKTGDYKNCRYYISPGSNQSYTVNNLDGKLTSFVVYLVDGYPSGFSASQMITSANCVGSDVVSSPVIKSDSDSPSDPSGGSVISSDSDSPEDMFTYGLIAITVLFGVAIVFGRRR